MQSLGVLLIVTSVRAYNAGEADGVYFLVMEYVDGIDLHRLVRSPDRRAAEDRLRVALLAKQFAKRPPSDSAMPTSRDWCIAISSPPT